MIYDPVSALKNHLSGLSGTTMQWGAMKMMQVFRENE